MSAADLDRVQTARTRLRSALGEENRDDPAIRLVEITSPLSADDALEIDRGFCVISGLSERGREALAGTVDALRLNDESLGLGGIVEVWGSRQPLHVANHAPGAPGTALVPTRAFDGRKASRSAEAAQLAELIETIDLAVLLSGAELRGADAAADELRAVSPVLPALPEHERDEARHVLTALEQVMPDAALIDDLAQALSMVHADAGRIRLRAACTQAQAAKSQLLPGDGRNAAMLADLAIAEADGSLAEYDMVPGSTASLLASCLTLVDVNTSPASAPDYAQRVLDEFAELESIRVQAMDTLDHRAAQGDRDLGDHDAQLNRIDDHRKKLQRRLRSKQQLLAVAREEWTRSDIGELDLRSHIDLTDSAARPLPILVEEPLVDLPARLSGAVLSTLLHRSARAQVICVSDQVDLRKWCNSVGDRAGWVEATGWFTERHGQS